MAKASGLIDLKAIGDASKVATNCIFEVNDNGIWVTPVNYKPDSSGNPITTTSGTKIDNTGVYIYNAGVNVAQYGTEITLGQAISGSLRTKIDNDTFWITDGTTDIAYIGNVPETITDTFISDGSTLSYTLSLKYSSSGTFSPTTVHGSASNNTLTITNGTLPSAGTIFTFTYKPTTNIKYYSMGIRATGAIGDVSFAEGYDNISSGYASHAEGYRTKARGSEAHAEGFYSEANGGTSHAEGNYTIASGENSHSEGTNTYATGYISHAEGQATKANGYISHAEGYGTEASGSYSHAQNMVTTAQGYAQTVIGAYNKVQGTSNSRVNTDYVFIIGNGTSSTDSARSNALTVDWNGNLTASGDIIGTVSKTTITSFTSGWTVYDSDSTVTLRKRGGVVTLTGGLKNTSAVTLNTSNTAVFTIPEGYRPSQRMAFITQGTGSNIFLVVIETNGTVEFSRYRDTGSSSANSYSSIAAGAWFPFHTTWIMD